MSGPVIVRSVLAADSTLTSLVPADKMIADEVAGQDTMLPFILLKHISGTDRETLTGQDSVHQRKRVQVEIHAGSARSRAEIKSAVRAAAHNNPFPVLAGYDHITLHTDGEGPDFYVEGTNRRIGEQDLLVTYSETT